MSDGHQPRCPRFCEQCRATEVERVAVVKFLRRIRMGYSGFTEEALSLVTAAIERGEHREP